MTAETERTMANLECDVVRDTMAAFQSECRLRFADGWSLHSWNPFIVMLGGGRTQPYPEDMICSVWTRWKPKGDPDGE